jgi:hypothetical protein
MSITLLRMQKKSFIVTYLLLLLIIFAFFTKSYAQAIYGDFVSAIVPPHYNLKAVGDNLYIQTNMKIYINNKMVQY